MNITATRLFANGVFWHSLLVFFLAACSGNVDGFLFKPDNFHHLCQFGDYTVESYGCNLDGESDNLVKYEAELCELQSKNKTQNIALASLHLIVQHSNGIESRILPVGNMGHLVGESRLNYDMSECVFNSVDKLSRNSGMDFKFDNKLVSLLDLEAYMDKIYVANDEVLCRFKDCLRGIFDEVNKLKKRLATASTEATTNITKLETAFTSVAAGIAAADKLKMIVYKKGEKPSDIFSKIGENAMDFKEAEKKIADAMQKLYEEFWHSEQRLIRFLLMDEAFWQTAQREKLNDGDTILGVFLHLHSRRNFCTTCRHALSEVLSGALRRKLEGIFCKKLQDGFFFNLLGSFRIHHYEGDAQDIDKKRSTPTLWVSYAVDNKDLRVDQVHDENASNFFLKRRSLTKVDEEKNDAEWARLFGVDPCIVLLKKDATERNITRSGDR